MTEVELFRVRIALLQAFLNENDYDGILLSRADNYAMATGGKRNFVYTVGDMGANALFVTRGGKTYYAGNNVERTRQMAEELGALNCEVRDFLWFTDTPAGLIKKEFSGTLVSDDGSLGENVHGKLTYLRSLLTEAELEKYRRLGQLAAEAMTATLETIEAGMTEADVAATITSEGAKRRCLVPIALMAADERIAQFRHPLPTQAPLLDGGLAEREVKGYIMVIGSFIREGLVASITRFRKVGDIPVGIPDAFNRICGVDAIMHEATEPGKTLGDVFAACQKAYADLGFPENEWHNHHQGGSTGYAGRTCKATPGEIFPCLDPYWATSVKECLGADQAVSSAFAWNPSAPGVKSEDTFLLHEDGSRDIITQTPSLPRIDLSDVLQDDAPIIKSAMAPPEFI